MKKSYKCVTLNHIELRTMKLNTFFMHDFSYEAALSIVACCVLLCKRIDLSLHQGWRKTIFSQSIIREIDLRGGNAVNKFQQSSREIKSKIKISSNWHCSRLSESLSNIHFSITFSFLEVNYGIIRHMNVNIQHLWTQWNEEDEKWEKNAAKNIYLFI